MAGALAVARGLGSSDKLSAPTSSALPFEPVTHRSRLLLQSFTILPLSGKRKHALRDRRALSMSLAIKFVVSIT